MFHAQIVYYSDILQLVLIKEPYHPLAKVSLLYFLWSERRKSVPFRSTKLGRLSVGLVGNIFAMMLMGVLLTGCP